MFPDFAERTVQVRHGNEWFSVPKLSVLQHSQAVKIMREAEITGSIDAAGKKLWLLLETLLPENVLRCRGIFAYNELVELCMYLAFGSSLDAESAETDKEYRDVPDLTDYQFETARILSQFSAYTLEKLLDEPASIFFALAEYAGRVNRDNALELIANGIKAAFGNSKKPGSLSLPAPGCSSVDIFPEY